MLVRTTILLLLALIANTASAQIYTETERAVWKLEETYWLSVKNNDVDAYKKLWDREVVSWGTTPMEPSTPAASWDSETPRIFNIFYADPNRVWSYELEPKIVKSFGDTVAAHYIIRHIYKSAETGEIIRINPTKITHTWQKRGDTWQIITGMSARLPDGT